MYRFIYWYTLGMNKRSLKKLKGLETVLGKTENNRFVAVGKNTQSTNRRELRGLNKEVDNVFWLPKPFHQTHTSSLCNPCVNVMQKLLSPPVFTLSWELCP